MDIPVLSTLLVFHEDPVIKIYKRILRIYNYKIMSLLDLKIMFLFYHLQESTESHDRDSSHLSFKIFPHFFSSCGCPVFKSVAMYLISSTPRPRSQFHGHALSTLSSPQSHLESSEANFPHGDEMTALPKGEDGIMELEQIWTPVKLTLWNTASPHLKYLTQAVMWEINKCELLNYSIQKEFCYLSFSSTFIIALLNNLRQLPLSNF